MSKPYIKDLTAGALLIEETKIWLELHDKNGQVTLNQFLDYLPARSEATLKRYDAVIRSRLSCVSDEGLNILKNAYGDSFKQILLLLVMNRTQIVVDFIKEIYCESKRSYQSELERTQLVRFIDEKTEQISDFKKPSESTLKKIRTNLIKVLANANLIENSRNMRIQNVFLMQDVHDFASEQGLVYLVNVLECNA